MTRAWNFSPGPATIPTEVLQQAADEMLDWRGTGMSVMEISHRGADYAPVIAEAEADLRTLLDIPGNYRVLFMQGGALAENAIVPLNMLRGRPAADYVDTGIWSVKSMTEAARYGRIDVVASSKGNDADDSADNPATTPRTTITRACRRSTRGARRPAPPTCTSAATRRSAASSTNGRPM